MIEVCEHMTGRQGIVNWSRVEMTVTCVVCGKSWTIPPRGIEAWLPTEPMGFGLDRDKFKSIEEWLASRPPGPPAPPLTFEAWWEANVQHFQDEGRESVNKYMAECGWDAAMKARDYGE